MGRRMLDDLPLDVLERICDYLPYCDGRRRSLFSFSLVSKRSCASATRQRFARMTIITRTREQLQSDVARWSAILSLRQSMGYVRRVTVIGYSPLFPDESYDDARAEGEEVDGRCEMEGELQLDDESGWCHPPDRFYFPPAQPFPSVRLFGALPSDNRDQQDDIWQAFVQLLKSLHGLVDFIFASPEQLPRGILAALHHGHPQSRLHMPVFDLRSLRYVKESPRPIDDDDLALATSPCLYSVVAQHSHYCEVNVDYNYEAVLDMMAKTAPNLKHVWLKEEGHGGSLAYQSAVFSGPRPPWPGFPTSETHNRVGRPFTLVLDGLSFNIVHVFSGRSRTDFTCLTNLDILCRLPASTLQDLLQMAEYGTFKSLRSLGLPLSTASLGENQDDTAIRVEDEAMGGALLAVLDPLDCLTLYYHIRERPLEAILAHHGRSLRCLRLDTADHVSLLHLDKFQQHCPGLRELHVPILRTQGNRHEVELYRSLGRFSRLERLTLWMRILPANEYVTRTLDNFKKEDTEGHTEWLQHVFTNAAIDAALARCIFRIISTAQGPKETLQYLRVQPRDISRLPSFVSWPDVKTSYLLTWIARSWICERGDWDNTAEKVSTREVLIWKRKFYDEDLAKMAKLAGRSDQVWRHLWPDRTGDWMESWTSFPLIE